MSAAWATTTATEIYSSFPSVALARMASFFPPAREGSCVVLVALTEPLQSGFTALTDLNWAKLA